MPSTRWTPPVTVDPGIYEFYSLGLGDPIAALGHPRPRHRTNCSTRASRTSRPRKRTRKRTIIIRVAVIGKPNVGKSSLVNLVLGENRVIVADVAGTTRDAVDTRL